jgi:hypothetical protein
VTKISVPILALVVFASSRCKGEDLSIYQISTLNSRNFPAVAGQDVEAWGRYLDDVEKAIPEGRLTSLPISCVTVGVGTRCTFLRFDNYRGKKERFGARVRILEGPLRGVEVSLPRDCLHGPPAR